MIYYNCNDLLHFNQWIGFHGTIYRKPPMIFMGKSMVSGFDFPSHQSIDSSYFLGVLNMGVPNSWMVFVRENPIYKWMIWGYPPFYEISILVQG